MRIKITGKGIYGRVNDGVDELPIGTELDVEKIPSGWKTRCTIISDDEGEFLVGDETLGEKYTRLTGKEPDARWKDKTIEAKIAEFEEENQTSDDDNSGDDTSSDGDDTDSGDGDGDNQDGDTTGSDENE